MSCRVLHCGRPSVWFGFCGHCFNRLPLEILREFDQCFSDADVTRTLRRAQRHESQRGAPNCVEPVATCSTSSRVSLVSCGGVP